MKLRDTLSRLDRAQKALGFKIVASILVLAVAIAGYSSYAVAVKAPTDVIGRVDAAAAAAASGPSEAAPADPAAKPADQGDATGEGAQRALTAQEKSAIDSARRLYIDLVSRRADLTNVALGTAIGTEIALTIVWLGVALSYLGLVAVAGVLVGPMWLVSRMGFAQRYGISGDAPLAQTLNAAIRLILGCGVLTASFTALLSALRLLLSGAHPVLAIARNMIAEAVRMKISLVFIVILIFVLAGLPGTLSQDTPLRYRVQAFLQYGAGGSYWIIAILILFFSAASVAFEQRDRQIWQTMTKPVAPWQYILGKWVGASGLAAVLLVVCCAGVFMFTEFLRQQPAVGESSLMIAEGRQELTEDRAVLETQVLSARKSVFPTIPFVRDAQFEQYVSDYVTESRKTNPEFASTQAAYDKIADDSWKALLLRYNSIEPGQFRVFQFDGLAAAKARNDPIVIRYRVDSGGNSPDALYKITFLLNNMPQPPMEVTLGPTHSTIIQPSAIGDGGTLELTVFNGALIPQADGSLAPQPNAGIIAFPAGGLEVSYSAGSYRMNFLRVAVVLWIKLAFLAMLAIAAATFLSFPVACLVAFSAFLVAEGAGFLSTALEYYDASGVGNEVTYWKIPVRAVGLVVSGMFKTYADLRPTTKLVDGQLLAWSAVAWGAGVLACWSAILYGLATVIFRRRELATYSGQ